MEIIRISDNDAISLKIYKNKINKYKLKIIQNKKWEMKCHHETWYSYASSLKKLHLSPHHPDL